MKVQSPAVLAKKKCQPCEGGVEPLWPQQVKTQIEKLPGWRLSKDSQSIRKSWRLKDFNAAIKFIQSIARLAEKENHHPDLHLTNYRDLAIEISTHAIGGLSENDFILAAKIDLLPVDLKPKKK